MRETDGDVVARARVYVDTRDEGKFDFATVKGRKNPEEITLFKSCGTALEDLATAIMVYLRS
jgi:ornithine cyclodeaminase/alanine dehydrogenase-like protein (mu-crystallin family)